MLTSCKVLESEEVVPVSRSPSTGIVVDHLCVCVCVCVCGCDRGKGVRGRSVKANKCGRKK